MTASESAPRALSDLEGQLFACEIDAVPGELALFDPERTHVSK